jgi:hypothetical protein
MLGLVGLLNPATQGLNEGLYAEYLKKCFK